MKVIVALRVALGFSSTAYAQELPAFDEVDQNGDGMISEAEAGAVDGLDFAAADADRDGAISREEYGRLS